MAEAYAAMILAETLATQSRQQFSKGKGKIKPGGGKATSASAAGVPPMPIVSNDELPFRATGTLQQQNVQRADRRVTWLRTLSAHARSKEVRVKDHKVTL
eukprot:3983905-Amphidinium_carterae.3